MPIPLIAQQTTSYLGAFFNFFTHDIVTSYNLVVFTGASLSSLLCYVFLRLYFDPEVALAATFMFNFAPYRIINIYIRGSVPEFFSAVFLPVMLVGMFYLFEKNSRVGIPIIILGVAGVILSHPFMFVVYAVLFIPYGFFLYLKAERKLVKLVELGCAFAIGIGLTSYYMIPLLLEIKYFYYGLAKSHYIPNYFLTIQNFLDPNWYYYYQNDTYVRGHFLKAGVLETMTLVAFFIFVALTIYRHKKFNKPLVWSVIIAAILSIILMLPVSDILYRKISLLGNIQRPWRFLSTFIFLPPIAFAYMAKKINKWFLILFVVIFMLVSFPQIYGKNYFIEPDVSHFYTVENLHGTILNTIWTSNTKDYPVKRFKGEVIEGNGAIVRSLVRNSTRQYTIKADSDIRMVDYTFYFPGWKAYIDGKPTEIQFQDPKYRGVITYNVPRGNHEVNLKFEDTKVRILGNIISLISLVLLAGIVYTTRRSFLKYLS